MRPNPAPVQGDEAATRGELSGVPKQRHFYGLNHLHYITTSTYRRARVFDSERFNRKFISTWEELRGELGFRIVGHVLMPEHFHVLLWPSGLANPSQIMQKLEERTAKFILKSLREKAESAWCQRMLQRFTLPSTVHHLLAIGCGSGGFVI
jgi:REP element-mobilizing transposase RayT